MERGPGAPVHRHRRVSTVTPQGNP
jgi:hypothetical protein